MITITEELFKDIEKFGWKVVENKINFYLEKEKQQLIDTYIDGQSHGFNHYKDGEDYYNQVFKDK